MAKKVVATLKGSEGVQFARVIKMIRSPKTGAYTFKEEILHKDEVKEYFEKK